MFFQTSSLKVKYILFSIICDKKKAANPQICEAGINKHPASLIEIWHKWWSWWCGVTVRTQTIRLLDWATFSDIFLHSEERWGVSGSSGWRFGTSYPLMWIHGGFPRTWYSGNHCHGRASQLGTGSHILATGIPEVHRHSISSGSGTTPMHPYCPHSVASEWLDPGRMVSLFLGGFGHILAGCKSPLGQLREVTYCGRLIAPWYVLPSGLTGWRHVLLLFTTQKVTNGAWCHPSSIWGCPRHLAAFCLSRKRNLPASIAWDCGLRSLHQSVCVCVCARRQAVIITFLSCTLTGACGLYTTLASIFFFLNSLNRPAFSERSVSGSRNRWFVYV